MVISALATNIRSALAEARRVANLKLEHTREALRSGGEDGLYRVHLADGTIVEVTCVQYATAGAYIQG